MPTLAVVVLTIHCLDVTGIMQLAAVIRSDMLTADARLAMEASGCIVRELKHV